jgi:predicted TIM-barrel fold metal-dependent hydrolase
LIKRFPKTNFLLDHLARPVINDGPPYAKAQSLWDLAAYPNVYLKLTSRTVEHCQQGASTPAAFCQKLMETFGSKRILWGSNYPAHNDTLVNIVNETLHVIASLSAEDQANILSGTAEALYPSLA